MTTTIVSVRLNDKEQDTLKSINAGSNGAALKYCIAQTARQAKLIESIKNLAQRQDETNSEILKQLKQAPTETCGQVMAAIEKRSEEAGLLGRLRRGV